MLAYDQGCLLPLPIDCPCQNLEFSVRWFLLLFICVIPSLTRAADAKPNVIVIFTDDQGYGDVGCYGAKGYTTPHLDQMAAEGTRLTSFYVSQAVCSASRSSLLTGCYNVRVGILGALGPGSSVALNHEETTIAEMLKANGYTTGMAGKWHLGDHPDYLPTNHGFGEYYGLPYSNDMWPSHPTNKRFPKLPLYEGNYVVDSDVTADDQTHLTTDYTNRALDFIDRNHDKPFFFYLAHSMPHVPLYVSEKYDGKTEQGAYGDVISEIDWSVGQVLAKLKEHRIDDNTLVIFTTDNGPWLSYGNHAGSAGPLREGKGTAWEGGVRVPCIVRWPGKVPAGRVSDELASTVDILPTLSAITGASLPERKLDGIDQSAFLLGKAEESAREEFWYFYGKTLCAVRQGDWKLVFPHRYRSLVADPGNEGLPAGYAQRNTELALYNLKTDIGETTDVKAKHPEIVEQLQKLGDQARSELGDSQKKVQGTQVRPAAKVKPVANFMKPRTK